MRLPRRYARDSFLSRRTVTFAASAVPAAQPDAAIRCDARRRRLA
jgi:hypothetical protein